MLLDWLPHITVVFGENNPRTTVVNTRTVTDSTMNPIPANKYVLDRDREEEEEEEEEAVIGEEKG